MSKLFNNKMIAVLAFIFITIEAVPTIGTNPNPIIFTKVSLWLLGASFVWFNKDWAAIFLAGLAMVYFFTDIVFPIPKLISALSSIPSQPISYNQYFQLFIALCMIIEIVFLSCFVYYGIIIIQRKVKTN